MEIALQKFTLAISGMMIIGFSVLSSPSIGIIPSAIAEFSAIVGAMMFDKYALPPQIFDWSTE